MRIIPAIDIIDGKCVRLSKGDYDTKKVYNENPLEVAKQFESYGIQYLHLVDLDGAKAKSIVNNPILEKISNETSLKVDFGGGIKSQADVQLALDSGAYKVTVGSVAAQDPEKFMNWVDEFGAEKFILGADCKDRMIATSGWLESTNLDVVKFIQSYQEKGIEEVVTTDISKDGMLLGPSIPLYKEILANCNVKLIASGGVSSIDDLKELKSIGCEAAIIGKAIYEGNIKLEDLAELC